MWLGKYPFPCCLVVVQAVRLLVCSIVVLVVRVLAIVPSGVRSFECVVVLVCVVVDCAVLPVVSVLVFFLDAYDL